jgi:hypothetical protein
MDHTHSPGRQTLKKFGFSSFHAYFWPRYANNNETYKANQEAVPTAGRGLIVLYDKIMRAFPDREGFFFRTNRRFVVRRTDIRSFR